jgi:hypothetical protein
MPVHGASGDQVDEELGEELGVGPALPILIGLLDPRPQASAPELGPRSDSAVNQLAMHAYAAAALRAVDLPLPPMGKFYSSAEIAHLAALALQTIVFKPWGWKALSQTDFYTVAADLLKEKTLPRGAFGVLVDLFVASSPRDPQRLAMAMKFLGLGFLQYLLDRLDGMLHSLAYSIVQYSDTPRVVQCKYSAGSIVQYTV